MPARAAAIMAPAIIATSEAAELGQHGRVVATASLAVALQRPVEERVLRARPASFRSRCRGQRSRPAARRSGSG